MDEPPNTASSSVGQEPLPLPQDVLLELLIRAERLDSIVVGGQALNIWAERFYSDAPEELAAFSPFQSKDIDFFGDHLAAAELAETLSGELLVPDASNTATPSAAAVSFAMKGATYIVDFLHTVAGLSTAQLKARALTLKIKPEQAMPTLGGTRTDEGVEVTVLHPADVLRTRVAGLVILHRRDRQAVRQAGAAPIVLREYIRELLEAGDEDSRDEAQDLIREMIAIGSDPHNDLIYSEHQIDILAHAKKLVDRPEWDERFARWQIAAAVETREQNRQRRLAARTRKLARRGS